eukprot:1212895-Amphidinium_carterae.1
MLERVGGPQGHAEHLSLGRNSSASGEHTSECPWFRWGVALDKKNAMMHTSLSCGNIVRLPPQSES